MALRFVHRRLKDNLSGDPHLRNGISEGSPPGRNVTQGCNTTLPTCVPVRIWHRISLPVCSNRIRVPFASPRLMLMSRKSAHSSAVVDALRKST